MERLDLLKGLSFGAQVAEEETNELASYFVATAQWGRITEGKIDIIRGEKGVGKSAIYLLLSQSDAGLFDRGILLANAENPRGTTVFNSLVADPPTEEAEFVNLWKVYLLAIICRTLRSYDVKGEIESVYTALQEADLLTPQISLGGLLRSAHVFVRRLMAGTPELSYGMDPSTGAPSVVGRISLGEPLRELRERGVLSIETLFHRVNASLTRDGLSIWVLLDRLDIAFAENHALEANALRALLRVYGDLRAFENIELKIFLREDIWKRVTDQGFRESSHLIKNTVLEWSEETLLNLVMRRILSNKTLCRELDIDSEAVLSDFAKQKDLFAQLFPRQVEQGYKKLLR
jgi:hypothetical protein